MVFRILHPNLTSTLWDASPLARIAEPRMGHCQLVVGSALLPREIDASDRSQQAHVTASHSTNARVRSRRW